MAAKPLTDAQARKNIAKNMQRLIAERDIHRADVARATGLSKGAIGLYCRAIAQPSVGAASRIASFFGVTLDDLLSR